MNMHQIVVDAWKDRYSFDQHHHRWPARRKGNKMTEHYDDCASECGYRLTWDDDGEGHGNWECPVGHRTHTCNCDDIAAARGEREAEAAAEHLEEIGLDGDSVG